MTIRTKVEAAQPVLPRRLDRIQGKGGRDANELWLVCPDGQLHHEFVIGREKARLVEIKGDREEVDEPLWRKQLGDTNAPKQGQGLGPDFDLSLLFGRKR